MAKNLSYRSQRGVNNSKRLEDKENINLSNRMASNKLRKNVSLGVGFELDAGEAK